MMENINEIKNKIYEGEGLLELIQLREDKLPELLPLVIARFEESLEMLRDLEPVREEKEEKVEEKVEEDLEHEAENEDDDSIYVAEDELDVPAENEAEIPAEPKTERNPVAFCLNDRFRFRRSLFDGDDALFNEAMARIRQLSSYEEAEDYFYGQKGFDPEDEDVSDFMEILRNYFA